MKNARRIPRRQRIAVRSENPPPCDEEGWADDAIWFERNPRRQTRLRLPMTDMERGRAGEPVPCSLFALLARRDGRTPEPLWVPGGVCRLDTEDMPADTTNTSCAFADATNEALSELVRQRLGILLEFYEVGRRALELYDNSRQAAEAARAAAQSRGEGGAA